jgi:hypothetical protein
MIGGRFQGNCPARILAALAVGAAGVGSMPAVGAGPITIRHLATDFSWGYRCGVKQPLGAFKDGLSVHQISKSNHPPGTDGNPDYLFWVDENVDAWGIALRPTDGFHGNARNPGGMVSFADDGTLWFAYGARAHHLPLALHSSLAPYDPTAFVRRVDDFDPFTGSSTPCVNVSDPKLLLFWRHGYSAYRLGAVHFLRYDLDGTFTKPDLKRQIGRAMDHEVFGRVGIEQLWTRHDPRYAYTFLSWQFFRVETLQFGSNPFLYSDDGGVTWRAADGSARSSLPIRYGDIDDVLVPFDHLARDASTGWLVSDLGVGPDGTFWMTLASLFTSAVEFWYFDGNAWVGTEMAQIESCKPHACGVTRDYIVLVYSDAGSPRLLQTRYSADDGRTWSDPIPLRPTGTRTTPRGSFTPTRRRGAATRS